MAPFYRFVRVFSCLLASRDFGSLFRPPLHSPQQATTAPAAAAPSAGTSNPEFLATADEVCQGDEQNHGLGVKDTAEKVHSFARRYPRLHPSPDG